MLYSGGNDGVVARWDFSDFDPALESTAETLAPSAVHAVGDQVNDLACDRPEYAIGTHATIFQIKQPICSCSK